MNVFAEKALECLSLLVKIDEIHSVENPVKTPPVDPSKTRDPSGSRRNRSGVRRRRDLSGLVGDPSETRRGAVEDPRTLEPHPTMLKNWVPDGFGQVPPDGRAGIVRCCSEMHQIYATDFAPHSRADSEYVRVCATVYIYIHTYTWHIYV